MAEHIFDIDGTLVNYHDNSWIDGAKEMLLRHTKKMKNFEGNHQSMKSGKFDYDYTPLFRFLQSKDGKVVKQTD